MIDLGVFSLIHVDNSKDFFFFLFHGVLHFLCIPFLWFFFFSCSLFIYSGSSILPSRQDLILCLLLDSLSMEGLFLQGFQLGYWVFQFHLDFSLSPSQCSYVLTEFYSQLLDCLHHSHQPHVCIFSGIAWVLIFFQLFLLGFIEVFHPVFFKLLKSFEAVYNFSFNFCVPSNSHWQDILQVL